MICGEDSGWLSRVLVVVLKVRELAGAWPAGTEEGPKSRTVNQTRRYGTPQTDYSRLSPEQTPIVSRAGHHHRHLASETAASPDNASGMPTGVRVAVGRRHGPADSHGVPRPVHRRL